MGYVERQRRATSHVVRRWINCPPKSFHTHYSRFTMATAAYGRPLILSCLSVCHLASWFVALSHSLRRECRLSRGWRSPLRWRSLLEGVAQVSGTIPRRHLFCFWTFTTSGLRVQIPHESLLDSSCGKGDLCTCQ